MCEVGCNLQGDLDESVRMNSHLLGVILTEARQFLEFDFQVGLFSVHFSLRFRQQTLEMIAPPSQIEGQLLDFERDLRSRHDLLGLIKVSLVL